MNDSSKLIIEQRIRNRIIEYLQMVDAFETDPPPFDLNELINQWTDWVESPTYANQFPPPIYSAREAEQLCSVATSLDQLCDATPQIIEDQSDCLQLPEWAAFVSACRSALAEMQVRGRLTEN